MSKTIPFTILRAGRRFIKHRIARAKRHSAGCAAQARGRAGEREQTPVSPKRHRARAGARRTAAIGVMTQSIASPYYGGSCAASSKGWPAAITTHIAAQLHTEEELATLDLLSGPPRRWAVVLPASSPTIICCALPRSCRWW